MELEPQKLAEEMRDRMRGFGMALEYDRESVARLSAYVDQGREQMRGVQVVWLPLFGAYLGECLIRNFGGRWELAATSRQWSVALGSVDKTVFPGERVARHIDQGPAESILAFYDAVAADKTGATFLHGSKWGVNADTPCCPRCGVVQPTVRIPRSFKEMLWGGWTCKGCGCVMDKWGRERERK